MSDALSLQASISGDWAVVDPAQLPELAWGNDERLEEQREGIPAEATAAQVAPRL